MEDIMSAPAWFNYETYVSNKLAQLQAADPDQYGSYTVAELEAGMQAAGYANNADGMYQHFVEYGNAENVSPSPYFVVSEYLANKLAQLQAADPAQYGSLTVTDVANGFAEAGLSAWDHYTQYGQAEGVSPSSSFDTNAYLTAKLEQLKTLDPAQYGEYTVEDVANGFAAAGLNPIEHYMLYGVNENLSYSPVTPEPGVTDELTTERDVLTLDAGDSIISGVASALSAEKTLNENDLIDGGEGNDTLRVTLDANFNGFTVTDDPNTTGGMKNVENVELTNNGSIARTFSAKGSEGVTTYTLHAGEAGAGVINLKDLAAAGITVNVDGLQKGTTDVQFATGALTGAEDSMTFGLNNVGAAAASATADPTYVGLSASTGLESVTINASGTNYADLSGLDAPSVAVTGAGSLDVNAVNAALTSLDASAATGNVSADLTAATMQTVKGGAGDDTFTVTKLAVDATLEGGAGNDTLIISGSTGGALQPTMSGFETIGIKDNSGKITLSAKNAQDFTALQLESAQNTVTVAGLTASAFTVNSIGNSDGKTATTNDALLADAVDLTVNVTTTATEATQEITSKINAAAATNAVVNVGANVTEKGTLDFGAAQSVQLNVASNKVNDAELTSFDGTINASKAQSLEVNAEGALGSAAAFNADSASSVIINAAQGGTAALNAAAATDVNLTFGDDMTLTGKLDKAQQVSINQTDGALTASGVALSGLYSLNVSGAGKESAVTFGDLGAAGTAYDLNVTAAGLAANGTTGFTADNITSGGNISLDFSQMTGGVSISGTVTGAGVTIATSELADTTITGAITANTGDIELNALGNLGDITLSDGATATAGNINLAFDGAAKISTGDLSAENGSITLDASGYLGEVNGTSGDGLSTGSITAQSVTIKGSELMANDFDTTGIDTTDLTFSSGLGDDKVKLESTDDKATAIKADVQTGAGNDTVTIDVTANTAVTTITVSGDMGGQDTDTLTLSGISGTTAALTTIDLSGLSGYTVNDLDYDTLKTANSLTDVKLGGGVDKITLGTAGTGNTQITFDGFTAGANGDKLDISGVAAVGSFKGTYATTGELQMLDSTSSASVVDNGTYYYEGSLSSITAADSTFAGNIFVAWLDGDKLSVAEVDFSSTPGTGTVTAVADVQLSGIEGTFSMDNFLLS